MKIVGCDLNTRYQQIAMLDVETGELVERRLEHESGEARAFYASLSAPVRVGIEATEMRGHEMRGNAGTNAGTTNAGTTNAGTDGTFPTSTEMRGQTGHSPPQELRRGPVLGDL
jgi:hypothetical protein